MSHALIEKLINAGDSGKSFGAFLTDLSNVCDFLPHELLLAKLNTYGFALSALRLIHSYLLNRQQRTKISASYNSWEEILFGVLQGSILGPLLFKIFMCDLFIILEEIDSASYADDNAPFVFEANLENVVNSLESCSASLFEWFSNNQLKANPEKCCLLMNANRPTTIKIGVHTISNSYCKKLLGVQIDSQLNFNNHLETVIKKSSQKVHVLAKINLKKVINEQFFQGQFNYYP